MPDRQVLPTNITPVNYNLKLYDLDLNNFTYKGNVVIDYDCNATTNKIHLNYRNELKIVKANVKTGNNEIIAVTDIKYNDDETLVMQLSGEIRQTCQLNIEFTSLIQDNMAGFYRAKYQHNGADKYMYSTQFESTDARCAFPCADEPNLKASFEFSIEIPNELVALSNMPVKSEQPSRGDGSLKIVEFEKLPKMSTYLYAWAVGEFEYVEGFTEKKYNGGKQLPVRVYTTTGLKEQGRLALSKATQCVDYFSQVFGIDYYLPKLDMLCVHEFTSNAMENTGLLCYRATALLFDEKTSDPAYLSKLTYVVCHEIAHQWFGNLVTMDWWDELWLNEGFATWVGWLAVDRLHPEWDVFSKFVSEALQTALELDGSRASHPIEVEVKNGAEIDQIFDSISYLKGASVIRMLSTHLGVETFLKGVALYLNRFQFANAKTTDLWAAVGEVSGVDVLSLMTNWTKKIGFPVLAVDEDGEDVTLTQGRFLTSGGVTDQENQTVWWTPLALDMGNSSEISSQCLEDRQVKLPGLGQKDYFKLNKNQSGFYRINYTEPRLEKIGNNIGNLSIRDKIGLVADAASTASAGIGTTPGLLTLINKIGQSGERSYFVWNEMITRLRSIRAAFSRKENEALRVKLDQFCIKLITPLLSELDWSTTESAYVWLQLRALIIQFALDLGVESAIEESKQRFNKFLSGDSNAIHPSLKLPVLISVVENSKGEELNTAFNYLLKEMTSSSTVDGREQAAIAAGHVKDDTLIQESLKSFMDGRVLMQDAHWLMNSLAANQASRKVTWEYLKNNWTDIFNKYKTNMIIFERILKLVLSHFNSKEEYDDVVAFFHGKDLTGFDRVVEQSKDVVKVKYQWADKDMVKVEEWLDTHA